MIFETHTLQPPLNKFIESVFYFKHFKPDHSIERVVPTGHLFIIFELDGITRHTYNNQTLKPTGTFNNVWISGMHTDYLSISAHEDSEMLVVQCKPYGGYPFLETPIHELNNKVIAAENIFGKEIIDLRTQILSHLSITAKFEVVCNWLIHKFNKEKTPNSEVLKTTNQFLKEPLTNHKEIINQYSKTQKHLISQFKKYCGLTPKVFHRICRFNELLAQIHQQKEISWPQIAYQFGYTDQSHFIKEFKEFSGFNPEEFISKDLNNQEPNFFPLDKKG